MEIANFAAIPEKLFLSLQSNDSVIMGSFSTFKEASGLQIHVFPIPVVEAGHVRFTCCLFVDPSRFIARARARVCVCVCAFSFVRLCVLLKPSFFSRDTLATK